MRIFRSYRKAASSCLVALAALVSVLAPAGLANAQTNVVTDGDGISGFRLQGTGVTWWANGTCQPEIFKEGTARFRKTLSSSGMTIERACDASPGRAQTIRDGAYMYFVQDDDIIIKSQSQSASNPNIPLDVAPHTPALFDSLGTPLMVFEEYLYWTRYNTATNSFGMFRIPTAGGPAEFVFFASAASRPIEMAAKRYDAGGTNDILGLVWLEEDGDLRVFRDTGSGTSTATLQTGVADFDLHATSALSLPGGFIRTVSVYAAVGSPTPSSGGSAGHLDKIAIADGSTTTLFTPAGQGQVLSVATDSDVPISQDANVYISVGLVSCNPFCAVGDRTQWRRKISGSSIVTWLQYLNTGAGANLESDNQYIYFLNSVGVQRVPTDAPAVQVDFSAVSLEVVQNTQNLVHDVPLVAGKRTYVRGYPGLPINIGQKTEFSVSASLTGFKNGVLIPGPPLFSQNNANVSNGHNFELARGSADHSFLWELPESWTSEGSLTLEMTVDPNFSLPETESRANNVTSTILPAVFRPALEPCLQVRPLQVAGAPAWSVYDGNADFGAVAERAATQLPVLGFASRFSPIQVQDQVYEVEWNWVPCFPFICYAPILVSNHYPFIFPTDANPNGPKGDSEAIDEIAWWEATTSDPAGCTDTHWIGVVSSEIDWEWAGLGVLDGTALIFQMDQDAASPPTNQNDPFGGTVLAHEIGHNHNRQHIDCGGPGGGLDSPPFNECMFGSDDLGSLVTHFGFDVLTEEVLDPTQSGDLMSYANSLWVSQWTYQNILDDLIAAGAAAFGFGGGAAASGPQLLIRGSVDAATPGAEIGMAYLLEEGNYDAGKAGRSASDAFDAELTNEWRFVVVDLFGVELARVGVPLRVDSEAKVSSFAQFLPYPPSAEKVLLFLDTTLVASLTPTTNEPALILSPPIVNVGDETLALEWTASDLDGDPLHFAIWYSADGVDWQTLRMDYPGLSATFPTKFLPGGAGARVRVTATDGFKTTTVESAPFVLDDHDPLVLVSGLQDGQHVPFGDHVDLFALGLDPEDGSLPPNTLDWQVSGPESINDTGRSIRLSQLLPGSYLVDLVGMDSSNRTGADDLVFEVDPLLVPETSVPTLDGTCGDPAYEDATFVELPLSSGGFAQARLAHAGGDLYVCFTDAERGPVISSAPVSVGVRVEVDGDGDVSPEAGDRAFLVSDDGIAYQLVPGGGGGTSFVEATTPWPDVYVEIDLNVGGWSAEFRIAEAAVGGWDHAARLQLNHIRSGPTSVSDAFPIGSDEDSPATWVPAYFGALPAPSDRLPVANAGPDRMVDPLSLTEVLLDGTRSFDLDGDSLTYQWTQTAGPPIQLNDEATALPRVILLPEDGDATYQFELVVNDGNGASLPDSMTIEVRPSQPTPIMSVPGTMIPAFVQVGDPGNPPHPDFSIGAVSYVFEAGTTEVTNIAYVQFLNSVAAADSLDLFSTLMETDPRGGIIRTGSSGNYSYAVKPSFSMETKPVNFVSWLDAARYVNWVENGSPNLPAGPGVTEDGSYDLMGSPFPMRTSGAKYVLPNQDEWVKAGYFLGGGTSFYSAFATQGQSDPGYAAASPTGNTLNPGALTVNYKNGAYWNGLTGHVVNVASTNATSFYGTYDQGGNVQEWTESPAAGGAGMPRIVRGGSFRSDANAISVDGSVTFPQLSEQDDLGFRVFKTDGPGQPDLDADGVPDFNDNCSAVANAPLGGTCVFGAPGLVGSACMSSLECGGDWGFCSSAQEDTDSNGIGLACDPVEVPEPELPLAVFVGLAVLSSLAHVRKAA